METATALPSSPDERPVALTLALSGVEALAVPAFVLDGQGCIVGANAGVRMLGLTWALGDSLVLLLGGDTETPFECLVKARQDGVHTHRGLPWLAGQRVDVTFLALRDAAAPRTEVAGYIATLVATEPSTRDPDNVEAQDRLLQLVTDSIDIPISYISHDLRVRYLNQSSARLWTTPISDLIGRTLQEILSDDVLHITMPFIMRALAGESTSYERLAQFPHGTRWIRATLVPDMDEHQRVRGIFSLIIDIDDDRRLREELATRERQLMLFTANIPEAIAYIEANRRYTFVNETFARYRGLPRSAIVGHTVNEILGTEAARFLDPYIERVRGGEEASYERKVKLADGSERWIRVRITPDMDEQGQYLGHYVVGSDVHDLKVAQEQLQQREQQLRVFMDSIPEAIAYVDESWRYVYVNHNFARTRGLSGQPIVGLNPRELLGDSLGGYLETQLPRLRQGETVVYERHASFHGETPRWRRTTLAPNIDGDGSYRGYYVVSTDIDELKCAQTALTEREKSVRDFVNKLPVAVAYVDIDGRFEIVNPLFCEYVGHSESELVASSALDLVPTALREQAIEHLQRVRRNERVVYHQLQKMSVRTAGGEVQTPQEERWVEVTLAPDTDLHGLYRGHFVIARDVHETRMAEAAVRRSQTELWQAIDSIPSPLAYVDRDFVYRYVNQAFLAWFDKPRTEVVGHTILQTLGESRFARGRPYFERALRGESVSVDRQFYHRGEQPRWAQVLYTPRRDSSGEVIGFYFISLDIHDKKVAEEALTRANWMLESHLQNTPLAAMEWDEQFRIIRWSRQAERVFGWKESEVLHRPFTEIRLIHPDDRDSFGNVIARLVSGAANKATSIQRMCNKEGDIVWCEWYHSVLRANDGQLISVLSLSQDVSGRIQAEERLQRMATHDGLTGLPNRILLQDRLQQCVARARRSETRVVMLFIDLDHFKEVNDAYGHRVGDELLKIVSRRVRACLRETDLLSRLSGDEFIVLMESVTDLADTQQVARRILAEIRGIQRVDGHAVKISASLGVSIFPDDADTAEGMLRNADLAMYRAKEQGKNTVENFSVELETSRQHRRDLEKEIAEAIAENELRLYYQPVVDMKSGRIRGLEALIRWRRRDGSIVLPNRFVPLAEETGLIREIGPWTLRTAAAALARWQAMGHDVDVAVNLAPRFFAGREAVDTVIDILHLHECDPTRFTLEVTETGMLAHLDSVRDTLSALREAGVKVALDDFGTGYSSLAYLRHLPIDTIKIDRTFVANLPDNKSDVAITSAIFALAKALGVDVIAEGVETHAQLEYLRQQACDAYQGYLFSHPLPESDTDVLLRTLGTVHSL
jgi:diguanylate cyclase (GGDEF)-like protein/PAS domain S-box-containing protein